MVFELIFGFNIKLKFNLLEKAEKVLDYNVCIFFLKIIKHLIIEFIKSII